MIALLTPERRDAFSACISHSPVFGARIYTLSQVYGYDSPVVPLWLALDGGGQATAAISRFGGCFTVSAGSGADLEEIAAFVKMAGEAVCIESTAEACARISRAVSGRLESSWEMAFCGNEVEQGRGTGTIVTAPRLDEAFRILCSADGAPTRAMRWESWYPHVSHLVRHGLGLCYTVEMDGAACGTGGVYAMSPAYAVLSGIATLPEHRGKGCGGQIVRALVAGTLTIKRKPVLCCANDTLAGFYETLGFAAAGRWGRVHLG